MVEMRNANILVRKREVTRPHFVNSTVRLSALNCC